MSNQQNLHWKQRRERRHASWGRILKKQCGAIHNSVPEITFLSQIESSSLTRHTTWPKNIVFWAVETAGSQNSLQCLFAKGNYAIKCQNSKEAFESQAKSSFKHAMKPAGGHEIGKQLQRLFWRRFFLAKTPVIALQYICNIFLQSMAQAMS